MDYVLDRCNKCRKKATIKMSCHKLVKNNLIDILTDLVDEIFLIDLLYKFYNYHVTFKNILQCDCDCQCKCFNCCFRKRNQKNDSLKLCNSYDHFSHINYDTALMLHHASATYKDDVFYHQKNNTIFTRFNVSESDIEPINQLYGSSEILKGTLSLRISSYDNNKFFNRSQFKKVKKPENGNFYFVNFKGNRCDSFKMIRYVGKQYSILDSKDVSIIEIISLIMKDEIIHKASCRNNVFLDKYDEFFWHINVDDIDHDTFCKNIYYNILEIKSCCYRGDTIIGTL